MANEQKKSDPGLPEFRRSDDFSSVYANNIRFETSYWDMKLVFGELDQSEGKQVVDQHTAVSVPWGQVKLMIYYLQLNLAFYEAVHSKVKIPDDLWPLEIVPLPEELMKNPQIKASFDYVQKLREKFVADSR